MHNLILAVDKGNDLITFFKKIGKEKRKSPFFLHQKM